MNRNVYFSIIIPTLNEVRFLPKILSDFVKQRLKNFEIVVVDGKSRDKTFEKALSFSKSLPLKAYCVDKQNVSYQRNFGASKAKGEFFVFLDADARVNSTFTRKLYDSVNRSSGSIFIPTLTPDVLSRKNIVLFKLTNFVVDLSQSLNKPLSGGGSIVVSRKLFFEISGFNEELYLGEDHDLIQRAKKSGHKAVILKDVEVVFNMRRIRKEGEATVLYKYLLATAYMLVNGEIRDKIFMYEMGGERYKDLSEDKDRWSILRKTSEFLKNSMS